MNADNRADAFMEERPRLLRLAYRYLGMVGEAEDVVQDSWLRFSQADDIRNPPAFLSTVVSRLCLDRLKSAAYRREDYIGPWLPEPFVDTAEAGDAALDISFAVMRSLEALTPEERAAFFLHDLFETPYDDIADILDRTPAACRKLAQRARQRLQSGRPRFAPETSHIEKFVAAFEQAIKEDETALRTLLAEDVEFVSDSGGKVAAARNVVSGRDRVARLIAGLGRKGAASGRIEVRFERINGMPGLLVGLDGRLDQTLSFDIDGEGRIRTFYAIRNPDKLTRLTGTVSPP